MNDMLMLIVLAVLVVLVIICFILNIVNSSKINSLLDYADDGDLAGLLGGYLQRMESMSEALAVRQDDYILSQIEECKGTAEDSLRKYGSVKFDAFDDITGKQSFSIAMLNAFNDGFILTSIYGHSGCSMYLRNVKGGECDTVLIEEEKTALSRAVSGAGSNE